MFTNRETLKEDVVEVYCVYYDYERSKTVIDTIRLVYNKNTNSYFKVDYPIISADSINILYDNNYDYKYIYNSYDEAINRQIELEGLIESYNDKINKKDRQFIDSTFDLLMSIISGDMDIYNLDNDNCLLLAVFIKHFRKLIG